MCSNTQRWVGASGLSPIAWDAGSIPAAPLHSNQCGIGPQEDNVTNTAAKFWSLVDTSGGRDACHPWTGTMRVKKDGPRGIFNWHGKTEYTHRLAWYLANGRWPEPSCLHHCDNPPCCNLRHLYEGTQQDNIRDREARGRRSPAKGFESPRAKLTQEQVNYIRSHYVRYSHGDTNMRGLAKRFDVHLSTIHHVVTGRTGHA